MVMVQRVVVVRGLRQHPLNQLNLPPPLPLTLLLLLLLYLSVFNTPALSSLRSNLLPSYATCESPWCNCPRLDLWRSLVVC